jgi:hypothetical protein
MDGNVLMWIIAGIAVLSLGFSIAAFVVQLKRKKLVEKQSASMSKEPVIYQPVIKPAEQPGYSQPYVQPKLTNSPFPYDDYEEKTQSLWSSTSNTSAGGTFAASMPVINSYKISINESGYHSSKEYELNIVGELTVGRNDSCGLVLTDKTVSGLQCVLFTKPEGLYVVNKSTSNITRLNGVALSGANVIKSGDNIRIGSVDLTILNIQKIM